jgi:hypothetical protein
MALLKPLLIVVNGVCSRRVIQCRLVAKATTTNYKCRRAEIPTPPSLVLTGDMKISAFQHSHDD